MAEEAAKEAAAPAPASGGGGGKQSLLLIGLAVLNMAVVGAVGFMIWKGKQKEAAEPKIEHVIKGEHEAQTEEAHEKVNKALVIPLETFIVNLAGSKGRRIFKVDVELEVNERKVVDEIEQRKAQIRDIIIIILSGRTYDQISGKDGKNQLRDEIKDTVNAFLTKGKITSVFFTNFLYN